MSLLRTFDLTRTFGALTAVDEVNLSVQKGTVHSLIGPNGAGKTTLFNMLSGELKPTSGRIEFLDADITQREPYEISHLGLGRSFQIMNVFPELSVRENLNLAVQSRGPHNYSLFRSVSSLTEVETSTDALLRRLDLVKQAGQVASELARADQRKLEVGIALATNPRLLLLDEPTSGMPPDEINQMMSLIDEISRTLTIFLVEHQMKVVMSISDVITVLHQGKKIAEGTPDEIRANERVQNAYLGGG